MNAPLPEVVRLYKEAVRLSNEKQKAAKNGKL
jgi:hypothetical protein